MRPVFSRGERGRVAWLEGKNRRQQKAERCSAVCLEDGAQEKTRTSTVLPPLGPEPSASTNSATWACFSALCDDRSSTWVLQTLSQFQCLVVAELLKQKRSNVRLCLKYGAQEKTRTSTVLPPLGPEPSASTNSATWACFSALCDDRSSTWVLQTLSQFQCLVVAELLKQKRSNVRLCLKYGAQEKTRTSTVLPPLGPEPSASTNSATWALEAMIAHRFRVTTSQQRCGRELYEYVFCL